MDFGLCRNLSLFPKHPIFTSVLAIFGFQYFLGSNLKVIEVAQKKKETILLIVFPWRIACVFF